MKEHEITYWGEQSYKAGVKHGKSEAEFKPPHKDHEGDYEQGYHEGTKERRGNR